MNKIDWSSPRKTDAQLRMLGTFELRRGDVPQRGVSTDSVVEHFDVLEQTRFRRVDRRVVLVVDEFFFE